jgi:dTDP-4-dehydrorhamnose reductase
MTVAAKEIGAKLVYVSTAGVFDGEKKTPYTERDTPHPQNYYGHSKYLGELAVRGNLTDYLILRVCWMIGGGPAKDKKFVAKIINQLRDPLTTGIRAVTDQIGAPTFGKDFISAIKVLVQKGETGIFHLPNSGYASRYDVATFIAQKMKPEMKVMPVNSSYFNLEAKRTKNETLSSRLAIMRPWQEALEEYLRTEWGGSATSLSTPPV